MTHPPNQPGKSPTREPVVALAGNPNSGKTSLFNQLTGAHQKVGNWGGVTVERRDGWLRHDGLTLRVTDLPGMYSLVAASPDEEIARDFIVHGIPPGERPDVVVQVIDGGNLERSLLLTMQLLEQEVPLVIALNMYDEVQRRGLLIDPDVLSRRLGVPVVPTVGNRGTGIPELVAAIVDIIGDLANRGRHFHIRFDPATENALDAIQETCAEYECQIPRGVAIGMLTGEQSAFRGLPGNAVAAVRARVAALKPSLGNSWTDAITHARYEAISRILAASVGSVSPDRVASLTARIDAILVHRVWGLPIFLLVMLGLFELTFKVGAYPMNWIDLAVSWLANLSAAVLPAGIIADLVSDGVIRGAGFVLVFLPNILLLIAGIHILEESGYMVRAAFLMDRVMRLMGLHGRSFIPLLMGFGCNVPALMGARTLESARDRLLTMLLIPMMSCSARLAVYVMIAAAFFPQHGGEVIFGLYLLGSLAVVVVGRLFGKTLLRGQAAPFMMELPPYRLPLPRSVWMIVKMTFRMYLRRIAGVVLAFSVGIWFLGNFPRQVPAAVVEPVPGAAPAATVSAASDGAFGEGTYIHRIGGLIEPALRPLGFTLELDIALVTGFIAKEVVVATLGVLYLGDSQAGDGALVEQLRHKIPSRAVALAFLVFTLLYTPCLTTVVTLQREARHWKWTAFSIFYQTVLAYAAAFVTLKAATAFGLG